MEIQKECIFTYLKFIQNTSNTDSFNINSRIYNYSDDLLNSVPFIDEREKRYPDYFLLREGVSYYHIDDMIITYGANDYNYTFSPLIYNKSSSEFAFAVRNKVGDDFILFFEKIGQNVVYKNRFNVTDWGY